MAQRRELITIEQITDCETGTYQIGELDYGIHVGALETYLERYGYQGKKELLAMMGHLCAKVEEYWRDVAPKIEASTPTPESGSEEKTK